MDEILFFIAGIGAITGAIGTVMLRNPFYSVLALVGHLLSLAALFLLLRAQFVAAAQVVVYAGAVMVLYVFVVAYVGGQDEPIRGPGGSGLRLFAPLFAGALLLELFFATLGSGLKAISSEGTEAVKGAVASGGKGFGSPGQIGDFFLTKFLFPFEVSSLLLLVAAVGAVVLARRRQGALTLDAGVSSRYQVERPAYTGTMAEAVEGYGMQLPRGAATPERGEEETATTGGGQSGGGGRSYEGGW